MDTDKLAKHVLEMRKYIDGLPEDKVEQYGRQALEVISDYPLYAASSNITYTDAILVAMVLNEEV